MVLYDQTHTVTLCYLEKEVPPTQAKSNVHLKRYFYTASATDGMLNCELFPKKHRVSAVVYATQLIKHA